MQAFRVESVYKAENDMVYLLALPWALSDGPYPDLANYLIHNRVEQQVYGVIWGDKDVDALATALRIMQFDMPKQMSDPVGEASYYERVI